jgi:hypothetical protein
VEDEEICAREQRRSRRELTGLKKGERRMSDDEEFDRRVERKNKLYDLLVKEALRRFGEWDVFDPVVWALLHVVVAQNNLAAAYAADASGEAGMDIDTALAERREAIEALQQAWSVDEEAEVAAELVPPTTTRPKLTVSEIEDMDEDELFEINETYELGINLDAYKTTHRKRNAVIAGLQSAKMMLED